MADTILLVTWISGRNNTECPKKNPTLVKIKIDNIVLIMISEQNKLHKMYKHLKKAEVLSFLQMVVHFM